MDQIGELFKTFTALDGSLYVVAITLAILVRFCRAYWIGFGNRATLVAAAILGAGGASVSAVDVEIHRPLGWTMLQGVSLIVAVLIAEVLLRKVPFLPADNALVPLNPTETNGGNNP